MDRNEVSWYTPRGSNNHHAESRYVVMNTLFAYGTLLFSEVIETLVHPGPRSSHACLSGYAAYLLKGEVYPGLIPEPGRSTPGKVYFDLRPEDVDRIDAFEDDLYQRVRLPVTLEQGDILHAWTYLVKPDQASCLSKDPWQAAHFHQHHLAGYVDRSPQTVTPSSFHPEPGSISTS